MKKRKFTPDTVLKANAFISEFKKDPNQHVEPLCQKLELSRALLYTYLREKKIDLKNLRMNEIKTNPISREQMENVIAKVDELRETGLKVEDAVKKLNIHYSTYYNYKNRLNQKAKRVSKEKTTSIAPLVPHTIEYVNTGKASHGKHKLFMLVGSSDALLDFIGKMGGDCHE